MKFPVNVLIQFLLYLLVFSFISIHKAVAQNILHEPSVLNSSSGFTANSLVLLADGSEKHVKDVHAGDILAAYDPLAEGYITTMVKSIKKQENQQCVMVSLMLILEDLSVSLQANGGLAGITLQASANQKVLTSTGVKSMGQVLEGEKLFCFDEMSGQFLAFSAYAIQTTTAVLETYSLETESNTCLINNTVVINFEE